ncbi:amidohydrolase family protein [Jatrophihabitans sp. DSM 45814]
MANEIGTPSILQNLHTEEFAAVPLTKHDLRGAANVAERGEAIAPKLGVSHREWAASRLGTAAGLRALNQEHGGAFYNVPQAAETDRDAAAEVFNSDVPVIDVQSHFIAPGVQNETMHGFLAEFRKIAGPTWWADNPQQFWMDEYFRCLFVESETAVAVLTSAPGNSGHYFLRNDEMAATRELTERLGGAGRLLNHTVVRPKNPGDLEAMAGWSERFQTVGWKVYTLGELTDSNRNEWDHTNSWMLDDDETGAAFLDRVMEVGPRLVCAHKGMSQLAPSGSPRDVGPAAKAYPDITFLIYHSGMEPPFADYYKEGPYSEEVSDLGTNRLVKSLRNAGVSPGSNVYAEIGATWFVVIKRPIEAAHVLGKLLLAVGEDNIVWGTDSIWFGPTQPLIDAFRAFQIPAELQERYGYPALTPAIKNKILFYNAARVYGIDIPSARQFRDDDVEWARAAMREYQKNGVPTLA